MIKTGKRRGLALCLAWMLTLSACASDPGTASTPSDTSSQTGQTHKPPVVYETFSLPYNRTASLNPFVTDSALNLYLSQLVTQGLMKPDGAGGATPVLALSVTSSTDNLTYTVKLDTKKVFSDATPVTVDDVIASAKRIMADPSGPYGGRLRNLASVTATDEETVVFTLTTPDPCFAAMLSFPIVKEGSVDDVYIGTGPYCITREGDTSTLTANPAWETQPAVKTILLSGTDNASQLHYMLETGAIDCYYTDRSSQTTGSFSVAECDAMTDGFLAFDLSASFCMDPVFRQVLAKTIDRQRLIDETGLLATLPLREQQLLSGTGSNASPLPQPTEPLTTQDPLTNPDSDSNPTPTPSPEEDTTVEETPLPETLTAYLTEKGYIYTDAEGYRYAQSGRNTVYAELTLAYLSSDEERDAVAEMLVTLLKEEGVRLTLRPYESMAELKNGLYLSPAHMVYAELSLAPNLDLSTLLDPVTGLGADLQGSQALWQAYGRYLAGQLSGADMDALLQETAFFTPLYSRKGRMQYDRLFAEGVQTSPYCIYSGAETWYKYE